MKPSISAIAWSAGLTTLDVGAIVWYRNSPHVFLPGTVYLLSALLLNAASAYERRSRRTRDANGTPVAAAIWSSGIRAKVLTLAAWQFVIAGLLGIWANEQSRSLAITAVANCAVVVLLMGWDQLIAVTDDPQQDGGAASLICAGRKRSRRLFFWVWCVYPLTSLLLVEITLSLETRAYPRMFDPPEICLLLDAVFSCVAGALVFQRYRRTAANGLKGKPFLLAGLALGFATVISQWVVGWTMYTAALADLVVLSSLWCVFWLLRVRRSEPLYSGSGVTEG